MDARVQNPMIGSFADIGLGEDGASLQVQIVARRFGYFLESGAVPAVAEMVCIACWISMCGSKVGDMRDSDTSAALIRSCLFTGFDTG